MSARLRAFAARDSVCFFPADKMSSLDFASHAPPASHPSLRSTMETKDTRLNAALETTKQLLLRAEQREERIVKIYDQASGIALARRLPGLSPRRRILITLPCDHCVAYDRC